MHKSFFKRSFLLVLFFLSYMKFINLLNKFLRLFKVMSIVDKWIGISERITDRLILIFNFYLSKHSQTWDTALEASSVSLIDRNNRYTIPTGKIDFWLRSVKSNRLVLTSRIFISAIRMPPIYSSLRHIWLNTWYFQLTARTLQVGLKALQSQF